MKQIEPVKISRISRVLNSIFHLTIAILLTSCFPNPDRDDEGHASFAREAIPVLLGRRPHGVDEVEAVADIAQLLGRKTAVKMMMKDTEYVDHWADVIVDMLEMQRQREGGIGVAQDSTCWGEPTRENPDPVIAEWVRDHGPKDAGAPTPVWNMSDLLRSAILIDDLSPVYRANLFTTSMRRAGNNSLSSTEAERLKTELTNYLLRVYLNRDTGCLGCHNPEKSTSNKIDPGTGDILWRRLWSIPGHPEKALFDNYLDGTAAFARITPIMRGDVRRTDGAGFGIRPWGMSEDCAKDTGSDNPSNSGTLTHEGFQNVPAAASDNPTAGFGSLDGGLNGKVSLWELEQSLHGGIFNLKDGYERFPATSVNHPPGSDEEKYCGFVEVLPNCTSCHSPSGGPAGGMDLTGNDPGDVVVNIDTGPTSVNSKRVVPNNLGASEAWLNITEGMGGLSPTQKDDVEDWITSGAPDLADASICNTSSIPDVHPDEAFAFLTAANLVDGIWKSAMGYRLTIDHGFPRNSEQLHMLWNLTEFEFIPKDWSLKAVLTKILSSNWFARRAPTLSQEGTAYELPPILDPWIVADPTQAPNPPAHQKHNGQGELVDMYRVNTLLRNISDALGWKEPRRFPGGGYPSPLDQELGQFLSPGRPGFDGVNFQSLLALESGTGSSGACSKSGRSVDSDDFIDTLATAIDTYNAANPDTPITIGEAWSILKDRLVQDTTIERTLSSALASDTNAKTEEQALVAFFREGIDSNLTINSSTSAMSSAQLENKLRDGCNIIVKSPQFMLPNATPRGYSDNNMPDPPKLAVCMTGELCGYLQSCGKWRSVLSKMGHITVCEDRTIRKGVWFFVPGLVGTVFTPAKVEIQKIRPELIPKFSPIPPEERTGTIIFNPNGIDTSNRPTRDRILRNPVTPSTPKVGTTAQGLTRSKSSATINPNIMSRGSGNSVVTGNRVNTPVATKKAGAEKVAARQPIAKIKLNLIKDLRVQDLKGNNITLRGINRVRQRLASLCLDGMCGFVERNDLKRCLVAAPQAGACNSLRTMCDPRCTEGDNCCGGETADADESGVLSIWAEGSTVKDAKRVRILGINDKRWRRLEKGTKLEAGDLLDIPLKASIAIQSGNVLFGDKPIGPKDSKAAKVKGHVVAVTGPSAAKILSRPTKFRALSPNAVVAGTKSGKYLSRGFERKDYQRILKAQVHPANRYVPSIDEIWEMNKDFDSLHFSKDSGLAPDGGAVSNK